MEYQPFLKLSCLLLVLNFLSGCAFGERQATLVYPPETENGQPINQLQISSPKKVQVILGEFEDNRTDKTRVGTVRNGLGMETADVVTSNSVSGWVMDAVREELKNNGYTIINSSDQSDTSVKISGEVLNVFCDMYLNYSGEVSIYMNVSKNEEKLFHKLYSGEGSAGIAMAGTGTSFSKSLSLALSSLLNDFIGELNAYSSGYED